MRIKPQHSQLILAFIEILIPFLGYWFWNWNILETSLTLLIEIAVNVVFFMLKCFYHIFQKQVLLHYFKSGYSPTLFGLRVPGAIVSMALVGLVYTIVFGVYGLITLQSLIKSTATNYESYLSTHWSDFAKHISDDAWTYIQVGVAASVFLKLIAFILYCKQNKYNVDAFIWILPPEYVNTKHLKILAAGSAILAIVILFISGNKTMCHLIIYPIALLHLFFTVVKVYFPVNTKNQFFN